jgi:hypothetical protein
MKITIKKAIKYLNDIAYLTNMQAEQVNQGNKKPMPITVTFAINRNKKAITEEYNNYVSEGLNPLNEKYNVNVDMNGNVDLNNLTEEQVKEYTDEINKLQEVEIEVNIQTIKQESFEDYAPTLAELDILSFMIED